MTDLRLSTHAAPSLPHAFLEASRMRFEGGACAVGGVFCARGLWAIVAAALFLYRTLAAFLGRRNAGIQGLQEGFIYGQERTKTNADGRAEVPRE